MSDYEATAYLSLEKLKVSALMRWFKFYLAVGKTHAGVLVALGPVPC